MLNHSLLLFDANGRIRNATAAPIAFSGGVGFNGGMLCIAAGTVNHVHQSNPFLLNNRLASEVAAPAYFSQGGLPHTAAGAIAVSTAGAIDHWNHGLPYTAAGELCLAVAEIPPATGNVYPNPNLIGGSNIVADVFTTLPLSHVATIFGTNPCDATYLGAGNPAYNYVGTGNSRFAMSMNINTATNRGVTLPGGREYRFSATVQAIGEAAVATRLVNAASPTAGALVTDGPLIVPDGTPQFAFIDFVLDTVSSTIQLRHGMGMFNPVTTVGATQQTTNLSLTDIGPYPLLFDEFTDVDNTLLTAHVPNIGAQAYTFGADTSPKIVGNAVFSTIAGRQICGYDVGQVEKRVAYNIIGIGNIVVFRLRVDMGAVDQNHVYVLRNNTNLQIVKIQAGVAQTLATVNIAFVSGERLNITDDGDTITASINGGTPIVANTTFLNTLTTMGLQINGVNTSIDSLRIGPLD